MATKMITRTISETKYEVMGLNIRTAEVSIITLSLGSASFTSEKKCLEALKARYDTEDYKLVNIMSRHSEDVLYAMTEANFIRNAIRVDDVKQARDYFRDHPEEGEEMETVEC